MTSRGPREAGRDAIASVQRALAQRLADRLRADPDRWAQAVEVGLIDRRWLEDPESARFSTATPVEVVERFLERSVEQRPTLLASLGLSAIQVLSADAEGEPGEGASTVEATVVFTDLEGFTAYCAGAGDEAASQLLAEHHRAVGPVVRSRGGRVVKRLGDGLLLTFPAAEAAVLAALELVDREPTDLRLRAGAHCGEVVTTHDDVIGHVVNVAARVAESAKGAEVLVTTAVAAAAAELPGVEVGRARRRRFKGVAEPIDVARVRRSATGR